MASMQGNTTSSSETCWVIGGGQFGRHAVELLRQTAPSGKIVVVDKVPIRELPVEIEVVCADGVEWFAEHFTPDCDVKKIIPALPLHLAADWLKDKLSAEHRIVCSSEVPDEGLQHFPHPIRLSRSRVVMSHADFLCPPDCPEPESFCTYTQLPRPPELHHLLEEIDLGGFVPLILRSCQFAPGLGGFFPEDLWNLLERARLLPDTPLLIGTTCKCHGIVDSLCHTIL
ncbi:MAG: hypothetical protein WBB19_11910 [Desulforhopalus sp.]